MDEYIKREDALDAVLFALVGTGLQSSAIYAIRDVPTADAVPKSEVEKIFEEIEKRSSMWGGERHINYKVFAELKKKYTEGKHND